MSGPGDRDRIQNNVTRAAMERMIGDPIPFGAYDAGCPKCNSRKEYHKPNYCFGAQNLIPELPCQITGEHLHMQCNVCSHVWLQRCKDYDPKADPEQKYLIGVDPAEQD